MSKAGYLGVVLLTRPRFLYHFDTNKTLFIKLDASANSYGPYIIDQETDTVLGTDPNEKFPLRQRVKFITNEHISHIAIFVHQKNLVDECEDDYVHVRFNANSMNAELTTISEEERSRMLPEQQAGERDVFYLLILSDLDFNEISATRVWIENPQIPVIEHILDHASKSFRVIIQGSTKTMQDFDTLQQTFAEEKIKAPLMRWFKNTPRRPHLQKGNTLKKEERPHYFLPRTVTFFNWTEYLVIQEQEIIQQGTGAMPNEVSP
ncbi:hypothetical protein GJ744_007283 [Endocarpon pusillum]|uniref:Uncharacterized protein n=1 Tax=Endocarpon pusillum TaxID=364733 RepID=A0A8H7AKT1_9EURO|nr:hypothetical protein GJ744_007283 [Endocarpon pusillum]